ncbi:hypothetical protein AU255_02700 [Methyloprofundus sedimenti]|uniref:Membrane protein 6-pyruvoyl-tetrahydropterin synthase-related domain-containing protein n=1 Tax=Methyloprofundus sedimenti TaxID=1420851 RepID=A0A1V8M5I8_9GAMM|nr:hypothetical protein [Methyloprofundus sedimenti]OQK16831.1 hypothetical protein AU255_02700 [Methyloprofundus sedimenti]
MRSLHYWLNILAILILLYTPIAVINPYWLNLNRLPTGGDTASHVFYAFQFCQYFPQQGLTQWLPEVFGGFPFLSYYFPLPFIIIFLLNQWLPFALAFKWTVFSAAIILPVTVYGFSIRYFGYNRLTSFFAGISVLAFLLHEQNSIWGGNLLSILAGEFSYSYGMLFAFLTLTIWIKALQGQYFWILGGLLEALTGFAHGYALLLIGFSSFFLLFCGNFKASLRYLALVHGLAFCLLAGWLWPMLEMHSLTIPNDGTYISKNWLDYLPQSLYPVFAVGIGSAVFYCFPAMRKYWSKSSHSALAFVSATLLLAITFWVSANRVGLADIRFFPYVWLLASILSAWVFGETLKIACLCLPYRYAHKLIHSLAACCILFMGFWLYHTTHQASHWSAWNHSGYEDKPTWQVLKSLFPVLSGQLDSPRLVFEHAPVNNDLGSTRALEALPMFLNQRPVLEGLYMESAILGPAIYHLQSEVSQYPSSPLVRFPSASMDIPKAAVHMDLLHANELLIRSDKANAALENSPLFQKTATAQPFSVYRLKNFTSQLIQSPSLPLRHFNENNWKEHAFNWFKRYPNVNVWPVYNAPEQIIFKKSKPANIQQLNFEREKITFTTDQPGTAHIVKIAYHPRWQLTSKGAIYMAAPGYLLVVPETTHVELVYATTLIGQLGQITSLLAVCTIVFYLLYNIKKRRPISTEKNRSFRPQLPLPSSISSGLLIWFCLLTGINVDAYYHDPERYYRSGWKAMNQQDYKTAADDFDHIEGQRNSPATQEEALFWAAKAHELNGDRATSKHRYQKLIDHYNGYWLPESLYTLARLHRMDKQDEMASSLELRLRSRYPNHAFTQQLKNK